MTHEQYQRYLNYINKYRAHISKIQDDELKNRLMIKLGQWQSHLDNMYLVPHSKSKRRV